MADLTILQKQYEAALRELACADMIDDFARREREMRRWKEEVDRLERELQAAADPINLAGSGPVPIEPREN
ncbi:MAG: hypothetical protein M9955_13310 [Rhizobiaceae bacterium]|nr:hypothetical protein [Rhizobiaceae bacterium]